LIWRNYLKTCYMVKN